MNFLNGTYGFHLLSIVLVLLSFILNIFDITRVLGIIVFAYAIYRAFSKKYIKEKKNIMYFIHTQINY